MAMAMPQKATSIVLAMVLVRLAMLSLAAGTTTATFYTPSYTRIRVPINKALLDQPAIY